MNNEPSENQSDSELASALERALEAPLLTNEVSSPANPAKVAPPEGVGRPSPEQVGVNPGGESPKNSGDTMENLFGALISASDSTPRETALPPRPSASQFEAGTWDKPVMEPDVVTPDAVAEDPLGEFTPRSSFLPSTGAIPVDVAGATTDDIDVSADRQSRPEHKAGTVPVETLAQPEVVPWTPPTTPSVAIPQRPTFDEVVFGRRA